MGTRSVGRRGLALKEVHRLELQIASGCNRQSILQTTGVSPKTLRKAQQQALPAQRKRKQFGRCAACGVWVKLPCLVCQVKQLQRSWAIAKLLRKSHAAESS